MNPRWLWKWTGAGWLWDKMGSIEDPTPAPAWPSVLAFGVGLLMLVVPLVLFIAWLGIDL